MGVWVDSSVVEVNQQVKFSYVHGDDRPYVRDVKGVFLRMITTNNNKALIYIKLIFPYEDNSEHFAWFWVDRIVKDSLTSLEKKINV